MAIIGDYIKATSNQDRLNRYPINDWSLEVDADFWESTLNVEAPGMATSHWLDRTLHERRENRYLGIDHPYQWEPWLETMPSIPYNENCFDVSPCRVSLVIIITVLHKQYSLALYNMLAIDASSSLIPSVQTKMFLHEISAYHPILRGMFDLLSLIWRTIVIN